ncbi:hypothetical protein M0813_15800 [Anaeramoeba flamelloides]|uniref:Transmembrane protein n=1 Tax=Anaeramoeba flamelloides TaxID=1746091 RepID=A0ABQ8Z2G1_9EUKA|nr:hypothetical protein M0813_15800 [Anaeramoeba flamelloides]
MLGTKKKRKNKNKNKSKSKSKSESKSKRRRKRKKKRKIKTKTKAKRLPQIKSQNLFEFKKKTLTKETALKTKARNKDPKRINNYSFCDFISFPTTLDFSKDVSQAMKTTKTLLMTPFRLERFFLFTFPILVNEHLSVFLIYPLHFLKYLFSFTRVIKKRCVKEIENALSFTILIIVIKLLSSINLNKFYHDIKTQTEFKLYVIFFFSKLFDLKLSFFGCNIMNSLISSIEKLQSPQLKPSLIIFNSDNNQFQSSFQKGHKQDQQKQALLKKRKEICQYKEEKLKSQKLKSKQKQTPNQEIGRDNIKTKTKTTVMHHKKESQLNSSSRNNSDHVNSTFSKNPTSEAEMARFGFEFDQAPTKKLDQEKIKKYGKTKNKKNKKCSKSNQRMVFAISYSGFLKTIQSRATLILDFLKNYFFLLLLAYLDSITLLVSITTLNVILNMGIASLSLFLISTQIKKIFKIALKRIMPGKLFKLTLNDASERFQLAVYVLLLTFWNSQYGQFVGLKNIIWLLIIKIVVDWCKNSYSCMINKQDSIFQACTLVIANDFAFEKAGRTIPNASPLPIKERFGLFPLPLCALEVFFLLKLIPSSFQFNTTTIFSNQLNYLTKNTLATFSHMPNATFFNMNLNYENILSFVLVLLLIILFFFFIKLLIVNSITYLSFWLIINEKHISEMFWQVKKYSRWSIFPKKRL